MGNDTVSAMQSGIYWGYTSLIEGLIRRLKNEIDGKPHIIATGGLASLFSEAVPEIDKVDPDLTLRGLIYIYQRRKK
jgi:type III pantothenate kinase